MRLGYQGKIVLGSAIAAVVVIGAVLGFQHHAFRASLPFSPALPGFTDAAPKFAGQGCAKDCTANLQGYETAMLMDMRRAANCEKRYQGAYREGCLARVSERSPARAAQPGGAKPVAP